MGIDYRGYTHSVTKISDGYSFDIRPVVTVSKSLVN